MLTFKWVFPWACVAGFLRRIVPDAAPQHNITNGVVLNKKEKEEEIMNLGNNNTTKAAPVLVHRVSVGERVL